MDSQIHLPGYDEIIQCPYEKAHQIRKSRIQTHLTKCKKNHKNLKYVKCPFNTIHEVPEQELQIHRMMCPDKEKHDRYKFIITPASSHHRMETVVTPVEEYISTNDEECWDLNDAEPYDPSKHIQNRNVIRKCTGKTPSEKKAFKEAERLRLQQCRNQE